MKKKLNIYLEDCIYKNIYKLCELFKYVKYCLRATITLKIEKIKNI